MDGYFLIGDPFSGFSICFTDKLLLRAQLINMDSQKEDEDESVKLWYHLLTIKTVLDYSLSLQGYHTHVSYDNKWK